MDKKNVLNIDKDVSLYSGSKSANEPKNTKVFVLPPELLKGLLLENKLPKLSLVNKNESSTVVDHTKNTHLLTKNISNQRKVQKLKNNVGDTKKTAETNEQVVEELKAESQFKNGTLDKSTENVEKLSLNKNTRRERKKLVTDKELTKPETHSQIVIDFSKEKELHVTKGNKNSPIVRVYKRKPRIPQNKVIKNTFTDDIHTDYDNICNEDAARSSNSSECISDSRVEKKDRENTMHNVDKESPTKSNKLTNLVQFLSNKDTLDNSNIKNKDVDILNDVNPNILNIKNDGIMVFDINLQRKNSDLKEKEFSEEGRANNSFSSPEQNIQIKKEIVVNDDEGEVIEEIIVIEETIENVIEYYNFDTDKNANTEIENDFDTDKNTNTAIENDFNTDKNANTEIENDFDTDKNTNTAIENDFNTDKNANTEIEYSTENGECSNDNRIIQTIPELDSTTHESDTSNLLLKTEENFSNVDAVSKPIQNEVYENCESLNILQSKISHFEKSNESFPLEDINNVTAMRESLDSNKMETKLIENPVTVINQDILSLTLPSENNSKIESLNFDEQSSTINSEIKSYENKKISPFVRKFVTNKTETESTENLEVNEKKDSVKKSSRLSKRYKPVINNYKRKQKNCEMKENLKRADDSLNVENRNSNELMFNKETIDERIISQDKSIKEPVFHEKNETVYTSEDDVSKINPTKELSFEEKTKIILDNIDSKTAEDIEVDKTLFPEKLSSAPVNDSNENILQKVLNNENSLEMAHLNENKNSLQMLRPSENICSKRSNNSPCKSSVEYKTNIIPLDINQSTTILAKCTKLSSTFSIEQSVSKSENVEKILNDKIISSVEEKIFNKSNENITVDEETPIMVSQVEKQEITKIKNELKGETPVNVSKTVEIMGNICKDDFSDTCNQETCGETEFKNDTDEGNIRPIVDVPLINDALSDVSYNDIVNEEINDNNLMESCGKIKKIKEILNDTTGNKLKSDISNKNFENILKDNATSSVEEKIFDKSDENCTVNGEILKMSSEFEKQEISKMNTELTNESVVNISTKLEDMENVDSKSDFSDTFDQEMYNIAESQSDSDETEDNTIVDFAENNDELFNITRNGSVSISTDEIRDNQTDHVSIYSGILPDESCNDAATQENDKKIEEILNFTIPNLISKDKKQEISKMKTDLIEETLENVSKDTETINTKNGYADKYSKEKFIMAESESETDEINDNAVVDVPVNNDELIDMSHNNAVNVQTDEVKESPAEDIPLIEHTLSDESHNDEIIDCNQRSVKSNVNVENGLKDNVIICSVEENCSVNEEIPKMATEFGKMDQGTCNILESQSNADEVKENPILNSEVFNDELLVANHGDTVHQKCDDQNLVKSSVKNNKIEDMSISSTVIIDNNQSCEATNFNVGEASKIEIPKDLSKKRNKRTVKTNCDLKMKTRRSSRFSSVNSSVSINSPETSFTINTSSDLCNSSCKKDDNIAEAANQKLNNILTDTDNQKANEIASAPEKKGRRGRLSKAVKKLENNSKKLSKSDDVNNDADNQINEATDPQKKILGSCSSDLDKSDAKEVNKESNLLNFSTNHLSNNSDQNLNTSNMNIEPTTVQKKKRGRITKSMILKEELNIEKSENDLSIEATNSEVNIIRRRSSRLSAVKTVEAKTKVIKRNKRNNDKYNKEIELSEDTENNKRKEVLDTKEVQTGKKTTHSESKVLDEESLDKKIKSEYKNRNEEGDSNLNLLKMENSNKDNLDVKDNIEDNVTDETEKQIPKLSNVQKKRRGRPHKSEILKTTVTSITNTDKKTNNISKTVNNNSELSDSQAVHEDSNNFRKRKRSARYRSSEFDSEQDLELDASTRETKYLRKRKRSSRFDKSTESNSQEEDLELKITKNESENEKVVSGESDNNDESNYDRPRKKRRKRGRPKGRSISKNDDDYAPHHSQVQRSLAKKVKGKSTTSNKSEQQETITCGKCGISLTKNQWVNHNIKSHNNLGWIEGTVKPDYDNNEKLVTQILARLIKKRKSLICENCKAVQRSVAGHLSHVLFCGKSEDEVKALMITCPGCQAVIKPSSLEYHERLHQKKVEEKQKVTIEITDEIDSGIRTKRKAAEKAITKISEIVVATKADQDDSSFPANKVIKLNDLKKIIQKPKFTKRIPGLLQNKWQKSIDAGEDAACCQAGCTLTFKTLDEIKQHYVVCNFTPQENFICRICKYKSKLKSEIIEHAVQNHPIEEDEDENARVSDSECSSDSDQEDTVIKVTVDKTQRSSKRFSFADSNDPLNKKFKFLFKDGICYTKYNKTFLTGFRWSLEFEEKNYCFNLFNNYPPNTFYLLKKEESKQYFPELTESMAMTSAKKENRNAEWKNWKIFEGQSFDGFPTFFSGGPVWALAWLPIPSFLCFSDNVTQFVAVSTHPTMDKEYSVGEVCSGKNIIQIWNMGDLNHNTSNTSDPKLAYAIAHDGGTVWCLEWCPSGCYDHEDLPGFDKKENELRRMGMLAAACSDGCIRVYSLIFPEDLPRVGTYKNEGIDECLVYKTDPVIILVVNRKMFDNKQQNWQVMKLSWTKERGHNVIVGGFSNGYVALWDLTTNSLMLKCKRENTIFLNPFKHFLAHLHAVTMVYLLPRDNKRYLVTTSLDRHYKFWDLEDITNPRTNIKKTYVTDASWFNHWNCVLLSGDEGLCMKHNYTHCRPLREHLYRYYNILPSNSTTFTVDTSDFGNSIANGTLAGEVLAVFPQQMMYINEMKNSIPRKRLFSIVSSVEVVDFQETENKESVNDKTNPDEYNYMPSTYKDSKNRFGLKFCDKLSQFRNGYAKISGINPKKTLTCEMMKTVPVEQYPFMSVNRVSWNPNCRSFLWLAVGYQNGFVRFISLKSMASTNEWNKMLTDHIKRLKARRETVDVNR